MGVIPDLIDGKEPPVSAEERAEHTAVLLELCSKYSVHPLVLECALSHLDEHILNERARTREAIAYANQLGRALAAHVEQSIVQVWE